MNEDGCGVRVGRASSAACWSSAGRGPASGCGPCSRETQRAVRAPVADRVSSGAVGDGAPRGRSRRRADPPDLRGLQPPARRPVPRRHRSDQPRPPDPTRSGDEGLTTARRSPRASPTTRARPRASAPSPAATCRRAGPRPPNCIYLGGYGIGPTRAATGVDPYAGVQRAQRRHLQRSSRRVVWQSIDMVGYFAKYRADLCADCGMLDMRAAPSPSRSACRGQRRHRRDPHPRRARRLRRVGRAAPTGTATQIRDADHRQRLRRAARHEAGRHRDRRRRRPRASTTSGATRTTRPPTTARCGSRPASCPTRGAARGAGDRHPRELRGPPDVLGDETR